jgi:hypothetical protein
MAGFGGKNHAAANDNEISRLKAKARLGRILKKLVILSAAKNPVWSC